MLQVKRVCVFNKTTGMLYRLGRVKAAELVRGGEYAFVRKGKLKSFLVRERKLTRNQKALANTDMSKGNTQGNSYIQRPDGRVYAQIGYSYDSSTKKINPRAGQLLIVKYPN